MPTIAPRTAFPRSSPVRGGVSGDGGARGPGHPVAKGALFFLSALDGRAALVVFSGGQDSTTCLAWALERFDRVATVGFDYGQRHRVELACRKDVLASIVDVKQSWRGRLGGDTVLDLGLLKAIGGTALTESVAIAQQASGLPNTFVPGRNLLFLTAAAACAYRQGIQHVVTGVCETDYSGYPDCRDDTIKALQVALNLGMDTRFVLHTPLMWIDKAATWSMGQDLGGDAFTALVVDKTHTCYEGDRTTKHAWGFGCNRCPACALRQAGYATFVNSRASSTERSSGRTPGQAV